MQLTGEDGNAIAIVGRVCRALKQAGVEVGDVQDYRSEAFSGDYAHVIQTSMDILDEFGIEWE